MVPLLIWLTGMDQRRASATSLAAILPSVVIGSIGYLAHSEVDLVAAIALGTGTVPGALIGTRLLRVLPLAALRWGFVVLLVVIALRLILVETDRGGEVSMTPLTIVLLVLVGVLTGIASGLFGVGGGVIMVPVLVAGFGAGDLVAKGTSLVAMIASSTVGTLANSRAKLVDLRAALVVGAGGVAASYLGVLVALAMPARLSAVLFGALLLITAAQLSVRAIRAQRASRAVPTAPLL
jgi:uncharacterized membrane protein YfcA